MGHKDAQRLRNREDQGEEQKYLYPPIECHLKTSPDAGARKRGKSVVKRKPPWSRSFPDSSWNSPHCNFSHPRTYASAIRKKAIVTVMKIRSNMPLPQLKL